MNRFTKGLIAGAAVGLVVGSAAAFNTPERSRRNIMRGGHRALKKCSNFLEDWM